MKKTKQKKQIKYGFRAPRIEPEHHVFGVALRDAIINASGQYPTEGVIFEPQAANFETQGCTVWGTHDGLKILCKYLFGESRNWEELYNYLLAGVSPFSGGDPHSVCETVRNYGLVDTPQYPFPTTLDALKALLGTTPPETTIEEGKKFQYVFKHQWVLQGGNISKTTRTSAIQSALQYGIVCASVSAWTEQNGIYVDAGIPNNHWVTIYGWNEQGWLVFDSYEKAEKVYSFDSDIQYAKLLMLEKKSLPSAAQLSLFSRILGYIKQILGLQKQILEQLPKQPMPTEIKPKYEWDTPEKARHSVRVICDEEGLSVADKNLICQVIRCESGFKTDAINHNKDGTTDFGIIQANSFWYIGKNRPFATAEEAIHNPEKGVRIMIKRLKEGGLKDWICFKSGMYQSYKP